MRLTLVLFIILCSSQFSAQGYIPLLEGDKQWDIGFFNVEQCSDCCYIYGYSIRYSHDTIVDDIPMKRFDTFEIHGDGNPWGICPPYENSDTPYSHTHFFFEDSLSQKVYWYDEGIPRLLYDFDVTIGDTVDVHDLCCEQQLIVQDIDTVVLADGLSRKRLSFTDSWPIWVEGIGNILQGPEYHFEGFGEGTRLMCFRENEVELFGEDCDLYLGLDELKSRIVTLFPNPMSTSAIIDLGNLCGPAELRIYDATGRVVRSEQVNLDAGLLTLQRDGLEAGRYELGLNTSEARVVVAFVVE